MAMEKPTPIECLEQGYPMTMARLMLPEDLTREDCFKLLEGGFEQYVIRLRYSFSGEDWLAKMKEWGLNKSHGSWASKDPYRGKGIPKVPVQLVAPEPAIEDIEPEDEISAQEDEPPAQEADPAPAWELLTAIEWLRQHGTIPDPSEVKVMTSKDWKKDEAAELLKAGATYIQMAAYYGWKGVGSVSYCVKRDGLVGVSANKAFGTKPVKEAEIGTDQQEPAVDPGPLIDGISLHALDEGRIDDLVRGKVRWGEEITGEAITKDCHDCAHGEGAYSLCNLPTREEIMQCVDAGYREWIPMTVISEAVHQAAASGEIKIVTKEVPTPAPSIDLASMRWFAPGINSRTQQIRQITFCADGSIRMTTGLLASGPAEHRNPGGKFSARVGINAGTVAIKPDPNGYTFSSAKGGVAKKCSAKAVTDTLTCYPVVFEAEWDETQGAYVGRLVESKAGVA
jgi:hypothetical protein